MLIDILSWGFLTLAVGIFTVAYYLDNFKCKHEWEKTNIRIYCEKRKCTVDGVCLTCKKCGKVKVIK